MMPQGSTFRWQSKTFFTTADGLMAGSQAITDSLATRGLSVAGSGSGGGAWFPSATEYGANVRLTRAMGDAEARQLVEDAFGSTFTFLGAVTASWEAVKSGTTFVATQTVTDAIDDGKAAAKAALPLASVLTVAIIGVAVIVVAVKLK